jgi:protein-S-isoprenylcysteine O-methyltransferase Ste14
VDATAERAIPLNTNSRVTSGDLAGRLAIVIFYGVQAVRLIQQSRLSGSLFLVSGLLVVFFTVIRRPADRVEQSAPGRIVAIVGTFGPLAFRPAQLSLVPDAVSAVIILAGMLGALTTLTALGRNFGIVAAHRGISQDGTYALVRHPLYASYFAMHLGFAMANASIWNLLVWMLSDGAQIARTVYEERILRSDAAYSAYIERVRWRLIPGVF